ncbi:hypothetical protein ABTL19_19410, partial [Acinetobacter baumannii]
MKTRKKNNKTSQRRRSAKPTIDPIAQLAPFARSIKTEPALTTRSPGINPWVTVTNAPVLVPVFI